MESTWLGFPSSLSPGGGASFQRAAQGADKQPAPPPGGERRKVLQIMLRQVVPCHLVENWVLRKSAPAAEHLNLATCCPYTGIGRL